MKKEYQDHWANMEDMHTLVRGLRIWQFITNFMQYSGYVRNEDYKWKDPFYMTDDEFVKRMRDYYNDKAYIEPANKLTEPVYDKPVKSVKRRANKGAVL